MIRVADEKREQEKNTQQRMYKLFISDPRTWGWIFWPVFHYMAWDEDFDNYCVENFCDVLPCAGCQIHCNEHRLETLEKKEKFDFEWSVDFHNKVSERVGKKPFDLQDAEDQMIDSDYVDRIYAEFIPLFVSLISLQASLVPETTRELYLKYLTRFFTAFLDEEVPAPPTEIDPKNNGRDYFLWAMECIDADATKMYVEIVKRFNTVEVSNIARADQMRKEDEFRIKAMQQILKDGGIDVDAATLQAEVKVQTQKVDELTRREQTNKVSFENMQKQLSAAKEKLEKFESVDVEEEDKKNNVYLWAAVGCAIMAIIFMILLLIK